jgi:hypothetical protein
MNEEKKYQTKKGMSAASAGFLGMLIGTAITIAFVLSDREMRKRAAKKSGEMGNRMKQWGNERYRYFRGKAEETREQINQQVAQMEQKMEQKKEPVKEKANRSIH